MQKVSQLKKGTLKRALGVFDLFSIGYGDLSSSIYYALGITALFALGATPIALALAGLVFVCTALSYAEMTSVFPESGGSASFARHAFNDLISFIAGWGLLLDYIVTIAISAFSVGPYLSYFFTDLKESSTQILFTVVLISLLFVLNVVGVRGSTRVSLALTFFTVLMQAVIIAIGLGWLLNLDAIADHIRIGVPNVNWSPTPGQFIKGVAMAMVAYTGIESIAQLSAESQKPARTVPRAIVLTMVVLLVCYMGVSIVALSAVSAYELGTTFLLNPVAAIVAALPFGKEILSPLIAILAAVVLTIAANAGLLGASRLTFNLGENYQLPRAFYWIHPRFRTPIFALVVFALLASCVVIASGGQLDFMADLYNFGAMLAFLSAHLSLIVLRIKQPHLKRPFKAPLNIPFGKTTIPLTAIIGALSTLAVWCLVVITKPYGRYLGIGWMAIGVCLYFYYRKGKKLNIAGTLKIEKMEIPEFKPLVLQKILVATRGRGIGTIQMACELAKMHGAQLTALQVMEVPLAFPLDVKIPLPTGTVLKRAEAIAHELGVNINLEMVHSRSLVETILEVAKKGNYDLIVLGSSRGRSKIDSIVKRAPCRVIICA